MSEEKWFSILKIACLTCRFIGSGETIPCDLSVSPCLCPCVRKTNENTQIHSNIHIVPLHCWSMCLCLERTVPAQAHSRCKSQCCVRCVIWCAFSVALLLIATAVICLLCDKFCLHINRIRAFKSLFAHTPFILHWTQYIPNSSTLSSLS